VKLLRSIVAFVCLAAACATFGRNAGTFQVQCNVPDAMVIIDDVLVGRVSEWSGPGRQIRPGFHRIEIRHPAYFSHYAEIELSDGGGQVVKAELHPLLD
jgi:hypothetical protein